MYFYKWEEFDIVAGLNYRSALKSFDYTCTLDCYSLVADCIVDRNFDYCADGCPVAVGQTVVVRRTVVVGRIVVDGQIVVVDHIVDDDFDPYVVVDQTAVGCDYCFVVVDHTVVGLGSGVLDYIRGYRYIRDEVAKMRVLFQQQWLISVIDKIDFPRVYLTYLWRRRVVG